MSQRTYSLAYLSSHRCTPPEAVRVAAANGYPFVGLRLWPNAPGAPQQFLIDKPEVLKETQAAIADTGVGIFDVEIIRIGETFDPHTWDALYDACAALKAKAILVAGDDPDEARLTANYARLCEVMAPYGLTADLEFMPWTEVKDAKSALRIVQNAGTPANAGILVDALHFDRSDSRFEDLQRIPTQWLNYAQICDGPALRPNTRDGLIQAARGERLLPGEGDIDLARIWRSLPATVPVSVEIPHDRRVAQVGVEAWARQALAAAKAIIEPL